MKIAILKSRLGYLGGLEKYAIHIAQAFAKKGHSVSLLTTGKPPEVEGVEVISLAPSLNPYIFQFNHFETLCQNWLKKNPCSIVFGLDRNIAQTHYRAGNGLHKTFLNQRPSSHRISSFVNPKHLYLLKREKELFSSPSLRLIFANSHMVAQDLQKTYNVDPKKIEVVHNGIDLDYFNPNQQNFFYQDEDCCEGCHSE